MSIRALYKQTAVTFREGFVSGSTVKKTFVEYLPAFRCSVQPYTSDNNQIMPGAFGKQWILFCSVTDIKEGDKIIVDDTKEYRVSAVETYDFGINSHMEVTIAAFRE